MRLLFLSLFILSGILQAHPQNKIIHYLWFDHDAPQVIYEGDHLVSELDVNALDEGLHTLWHVAVLPDGTLTPPKTSCFLKNTDINAVGTADCHVIIDNNDAVRHECRISDGLIHLNLDMSELTDGLHQLKLFVVPTKKSIVIQPRTAYFVKRPTGGTDIARYCYWINSDTDKTVTIECDTPRMPLDIVDLVEIPEYGLRTASYDLDIELSELVMNARHMFNFWAMDKSGRFSQTMTQEYTDRRTQSKFPIENIETLPSCTAKPVGKIADNDIKWYKFDGETGDSISARLSQSAMYELYAPSGLIILQKKGALSETVSTATLMETGTFFLAVHDIASSVKDRLKLDFHHVPRNAILDVTPSEISPTRSFTSLDLFGNGMSDATRVILENNNGVRYETDSLYVYDNYHLNAAIRCKEKLAEGNYRVSMTVIDKISGEEKIVYYPDVVKVMETGGNAKINIEVIPSRKAATPYMVDIRISNDSDVPCWGIPISLACERDGGKNGFIFYMSDFLGTPISLESFDWYESDNILGTGKDGLYLPMILTHMQPHESRTLKVGIISEPHAKVGLYAWAGEPYNEAADRLLSLPPDSLESMHIIQSNLFDFENEIYTKYVIDELTRAHETEASPLRIISKENEWVLENLKDYGPDAIGRYKPLGKSAGAAGLASSISEANAHTFAGIGNSGDNAAVFIRWKNNGIPGNSIGEQLQYIYDMNMQNNYDIVNDVAIVTSNMARSKSPRRIVYDLGRDQLPWWVRVTDSFCRSNATSSNPMPDRREVESYQSGDPNMITGYTDPTGGNYIAINVNKLHYTIEFENDPEIANAPASRVIVDNSLDGDIFDLSSLTPENIQIGDRTIDLPASHSFVITTDMRPKVNCILETRFSYSDETGSAVWHFNSLDPVSLEPVQDFRQGFLPVNDASGKGAGRISYSVRLKEGLEHGTTVRNSASIIFDDNAPVLTPEWVNVTDYEIPMARIIKQYGHDGSCYTFEVETSDIGSGVHTYDLYARADKTHEWSVVMSSLTDPHVEFKTDKPIDNIEFMVRATDRAGNRQVNHPTLTATDRIEDDPALSESENWYDINGLVIDKANAAGKTVVSSTGRKIIIR